jgi:pyrophosphatase PpaX
MPAGAVVFDLDGTLLDTIGLILASHRHATQLVLGASPPDGVLREGIGRSLRAQMEALDAERAQDLYDAYRAYNHRVHDDHVRAFPGMLELCRRLRDRGVPVAVATSKSADTVNMAFRLVPLEQLLDAVVTSDMTQRHKPDPAPIRLALELLGAEPAGACYVGDAPADIHAARAAGVSAVAVTWGAFDESRLRGEHPDAVATTPEELEEILLGSEVADGR